MSEARIKILKLLSDGAIDAEEAGKLLAALKTGDDAAPPAMEVEVEVAEPVEEAPALPPQAPEETDTVEIDVEAEAPSEHEARFHHETEGAGEQPKAEGKRLRITVSGRHDGADRVNVSLPLSLVQFGLRIGERFAPEMKGVDWNDFDVEIEGDGETVRLFVE